MRIAQLKYTRFGHFTDFALNLPLGDSDFHIILGANEAGKSTMVEGWLNLLYGIPRKTSYAFRHERSTLEISATLEDDGRSQSLTRLPTNNQNLVDADGHALPEAVLTGLLRGVGEDAYRHLYCLDDDTIEKGGDDILASKGDLGQLLFAAASGLATFNEALEAMREADRAFHVASGAGRRGSTLAQLRRQLDDLNARIKAADLTVPDYRRLRDAAEQTAAAADEAKVVHSALIAEDGALRAKLRALPVLSDLEALETDLQRLGPQPVLPEGTGAELADLSERREGHLAMLRARRADLATWSAEREDLAMDPRADGLAEALTGLRPLRSRAEEAAQDLPKRQVEQAATEAAAARLLSRLGMTGTDPARLAVSAASVDRLDKAAQAHDRAERQLLNATREAELAADALTRAREITPEAGQTQTNPDALEALLRELDADAATGALVEARAAYAEAEEAACNAVTELTIAGVTFAAPGPVPLTAEGADDLAKALQGLSGRLAVLVDTLTQQDRQVSGLAAELAALAAQGNALSDAEAADLRTARDGQWAQHRAALSPRTADAFAAAMAADDAATALRLLDTARLADLRHAERDHARILAEQDATSRERATVLADEQALRARLSRILAEIGLPDGLTPAELSDWLSRHHQAVTALGEADRARTAMEELEALAAPIAAALAGALALPDSGLPDLLGMAHRRIAESRARQDLVAAATRHRTAAEQALARREEVAEQAGLEFDQVMGELSAALSGLGIALPKHVEPSDAVPVLRALIAEQQKLASLHDRIGKMEANTADFAAQIAALATPWPDLTGKPPLELAATLDRIAAEHRRGIERSRDLTVEMQRAEALIATADTELKEIESRAAEIALAWPEMCRPEGFRAIAEAAVTAARAAEILDRKAGAERLLARTLGVDDLADARSDLSGTSEMELKARQQVLSPELTRAAETRDEAIRNLGLAEQALREVSGEGDVARLSQDRQVLLEEIGTTARDGLRRRLGLMLAERALARYRDEHRGTMLAETEAAFLDLTGGAYTGLSAQQDGTSEVLLAHRSADGRSLRVGEGTMSKGTRFQLYLALRLAGYRQMADAGTVLPFLCDDIFETFDETRTAAACRLMHRIGEIGQALYFTHHAHVAEIAQSNCPGVQVHYI